MTKFKVQVNPFTREAIVQTEINGIEYKEELIFEDLDYWISFQFGDDIFGAHFYYDYEFSVSIYAVKNNEIQVSESFQTELTIKLTD